jgi:NitT/TauT family transport system substrate-binding protein
MRRSAKLILVAVVIGVVLISGATAYLLTQPSGSARVYNIKIGNVPAMTYAPTYIAVSLFMKDLGVNATYVAFPSGGKAREALIAGDLDFASLSTVHVPLARIKDRPLKIILALHNKEIFTLMVRSDLKDEVRAVSDLKGRRIGFSSPGSGSWAFAIHFLRSGGLDPERDVEMVAVGGISTMYASLKSGEIDAAVTWDPLTTKLMVSGEAYPLIDLYDPEQHQAIMGGEALSQVLVTREEIIESNPDLVERVVKAHIEALRFIQEKEPSEIAKVLQPYFEGMELPLLERVVERIKAAIPSDGSLSESAYYTDLAPLLEAGVLARNVTFNEAADWTFSGRRP